MELVIICYHLTALLYFVFTTLATFGLWQEHRAATLDLTCKLCLFSNDISLDVTSRTRCENRLVRLWNKPSFCGTENSIFAPSLHRHFSEVFFVNIRARSRSKNVLSLALCCFLILETILSRWESNAFLLALDRFACNTKATFLS